ncbi:L-type lectin-domain containing receptor kinase S.4-like [Cryptomeria japonica]|uniref:L-type lectin-domain containing receptor kinase S.4-like n=1 Tax=Cryptomeria japonica TaxID=3369 RepID=UPI0027DA1150|nr:L-type lectin-domain containing receptor kinase S.4-like [Cryptomeria japonica]
MGKASNHLFDVEFSTLKNFEFYDINDNHVSVDLNDLRSVKSIPYGFWTGNNQFQAATGVNFEENYILYWSFNTNKTVTFLNTSDFASFIPRDIKNPNARLTTGNTTTCVVLLLVVVAASLVRLKRKQYRNLIEEWQMEYWPHKFQYKDLHIATKGFGETQLLGCGGFSQVYKEVLPSNGLQVAVKRILRETYDGVKDFIAEISSLGHL